MGCGKGSIFHFILNEQEFQTIFLSLLAAPCRKAPKNVIARPDSLPLQLGSGQALSPFGYAQSLP